MYTGSANRRRVLVIEPDLGRAADLQHWLHSDVVEIEVVASADEALLSIARQPVDLVMTSTLLPPADTSLLTAHIGSLPGRPPQIVDLPVLRRQQSRPQPGRQRRQPPELPAPSATACVAAALQRRPRCAGKVAEHLRRGGDRTARLSSIG